MVELVLEVPGMWADHHVIAVREVLQREDGLTVTAASARDATVRIEYDPERADLKHVVTVLEAAGYQTGKPEPASAPPTDKPAWATAGVRVTTTNPADLKMSGDHRKY
jgi:copper chaperone CopZ